jgi:GTPase SAR1 family protein
MPHDKAFFAYPGSPRAVAQTIIDAVKKHNAGVNTLVLEAWQTNDISGIPVTAPIFEKIGSGLYLAADITCLNENVAFEVGYAIGCGRRCLLFRNAAIVGDKELIGKVGIFDTLGYEEYENSDQLAASLLDRTNFDPIAITKQINHRAPVYIVEPRRRTDAHTALVSRVKKARWMYRSFNPGEDVRLAAMDAVRHVAQSAGVIVPLLSDGATDQREHNIRAMFVAGLSLGLEVPTLIIHSDEFVPPIDVRDVTKKFRFPDDIRDHVQDFSLEINEYSQQGGTETAAPESVLNSLRIGDPTAENEMTTLNEYYVSTDNYQKCLRGEANLVVGRKGSGKTALFVQLRNHKRENKQNVVVDLKPEGYQLVKLKERVLDFMTAGAQQHLITAFWEYLLLLEITYKVLEKDQKLHMRDHRLTDKYQALALAYSGTDGTYEGDFSERLLKLSSALAEAFSDQFGQTSSINITQQQVTELLHKHDIKELSGRLAEYLKFKDEVWLLFDNIDKGWSVEGVSAADIFVLRCLIDASRKVEREFQRRDLEFHSVVFIRDDVYSLLMSGSADYGKEMRAALDWSERDLLADVLKRRLANALSEQLGAEFNSIWSRVAVSHYMGDTTIDHMTDRCLMRPRNLIKIFRHALSIAINAGHDRIQVDDITKGLRTYSQDLVIEVDRELTDIFPKAKRLIYDFSEEHSEFTHGDLIALCELAEIEAEEAERVIAFLLYYGVLGVKRDGADPIYIYDVQYDIEMLRARMRKWGSASKYLLNTALWPALRINADNQPRLV